MIVCRMDLSRFGETFRNKVIGNETVKPFVLLNNDVRDHSDCTLLHEMIHASHSHPQDHDGEPFSVFFRHGSETNTDFDRTALFEVRARELAKGHFAL